MCSPSTSPHVRQMFSHNRQDSGQLSSEHPLSVILVTMSTHIASLFIKNNGQVVCFFSRFSFFLPSIPSRFHKLSAPQKPCDHLRSDDPVTRCITAFSRCPFRGSCPPSQPFSSNFPLYASAVVVCFLTRLRRRSFRPYQVICFSASFPLRLETPPVSP